MEQEYFARGRFGEIMRTEDGKVLKLFFPEYPKEKAEAEFRNAKIAYELGCTPIKVYEMVERDGRYGFTMDYCPGVSGNDMAFKKPSYILRGGKDLAAQHALVHSKKCHELRDIRTYVCGVLDNCPHMDFLTADEKERAKKYIMSLPEEDTVLHLDLHTGNMMVDADGTVRIIDWTEASRGNRAVEIALMRFFFTEAELFAEATALQNWVFARLRTIVGKPFFKEYRRLMPYEDEEVEKYALIAYLYRREWDLVTEREKLSNHIKRCIEERCR